MRTSRRCLPRQTLAHQTSVMASWRPLAAKIIKSRLATIGCPERISVERLTVSLQSWSMIATRTSVFQNGQMRCSVHWARANTASMCTDRRLEKWADGTLRASVRRAIRIMAPVASARTTLRADWWIRRWEGPVVVSCATMARTCARRAWLLTQRVVDLASRSLCSRLSEARRIDASACSTRQTPLFQVRRPRWTLMLRASDFGVGLRRWFREINEFSW